MKSHQRTAAFSVAMIIMGMLLSVQYKSTNTAERELYKQRPENLIAMIRNLTEKRSKLGLEMTDLSDQLADRRNAYEDQTLVAKSIEQELAKLEIVNGSREVRGPGLDVTFLSTSMVQFSDLITLVNELWASGAEAISVSGVRIISSSYIYYREANGGLEITVNNQPVTWPLKVLAIGNSNNLEKGLTLPGGFTDMMAYNKIYPTLRQKEALVLPAIKTPPRFYYLKEYAAEGTTPVQAAGTEKQGS